MSLAARVESSGASHLAGAKCFNDTKAVASPPHSKARLRRAKSAV
jgi:hypothetical protein